MQCNVKGWEEPDIAMPSDKIWKAEQGMFSCASWLIIHIAGSILYPLSLTNRLRCGMAAAVFPWMIPILQSIIMKGYNPACVLLEYIQDGRFLILHSSLNTPLSNWLDFHRMHPKSGRIQWNGQCEWYRGEKADRIAHEKKRNRRLNSPAQEQEQFSFYRCDTDETATVNAFERKAD